MHAEKFNSRAGRVCLFDVLHPRHLNVMFVHSDYLISCLSLLLRPQFTVGLLMLTMFFSPPENKKRPQPF